MFSWAGADTRLRILWLNWRDLAHPKAGGAEVYTHEVGRRLVKRGHAVTLFTGAAPGLSPSDVVDGIEIRRRGGAVTTRLMARRWLRSGSAGAFDVVVEEINTIPYFARWWAGLPTVVLIHQVAREVWWWEAPAVLAPIGRAAEPVALRGVRGPAIALSNSTRDDLISLGFPSGAVRVIHPGISLGAPIARPTERDPTQLTFVGRLAPSKRIDAQIEALALLMNSGRAARLAIVGRGDPTARARLEAQARALRVSDRVVFHDFLPADERDRLLASSLAVVMSSVREGWGMSVTEANALGTPSVVYRRPGLKDSTRHEETGLVVDPTPQALADGVMRLMDEPQLHARLSRGAREWAATLTWDATTARVEDSLLQVVAASRSHARARAQG